MISTVYHLLKCIESKNMTIDTINKFKTSYAVIMPNIFTIKYNNLNIMYNNLLLVNKLISLYCNKYNYTYDFLTIHYTQMMKEETILKDIKNEEEEEYDNSEMISL